MSDILRVGDRVSSRFGNATVARITLVAEQGDKGENVDTSAAVPFMPWALVRENWAVVDLSNKHWCYGDQIAPADTTVDDYRDDYASTTSGNRRRH